MAAENSVRTKSHFRAAEAVTASAETGQHSNDRHRRFRLLRLRLSGDAVPDRLRNPIESERLTWLQVLPDHAENLTMAKASESGSQHNGRSRLGQRSHHLCDLLKAVGICFIGSGRIWDGDSGHGISPLKRSLLHSEPVDTAEQMLDMLERRFVESIFACYLIQQALNING